MHKDVERCFGVLEGRFEIFWNPCQHRSIEVMSDFMFAYCILHNMILEDKRDVVG